MSQIKSQTPSDQMGTELSESQRHRLLSHERRRELLDVVSDRTGPLELADLVTELVSREPDIETGDEEAVRRVRIGLHHNHLPMLDDYGVIDYDPETNRILL